MDDLPRRIQRKPLIDPIDLVERTIDRAVKQPASSCCCWCCRCRNLAKALRWAIGLFVFEALFHITISFVRPQWEWTSSAVTVVAFVLQDVCRLVLLLACVPAWRALSLEHGLEGVPVLRRLLCGLVLLLVLEMVEMVLKFWEVHAVCDAPEVWRVRELRNGTAMSETMCEVFSDLYDFLWGVATLVFLALVAYLLRSHIRNLQRHRHRQASAMANSILGEVAALSRGEDPRAIRRAGGSFGSNDSLAGSLRWSDRAPADAEAAPAPVQLQQPADEPTTRSTTTKDMRAESGVERV